MKIIDSTINPNNSASLNPEYLTITFFSRIKDEMPQVTKVGSIIRVHRGMTRLYYGSIQINCDTGIKSAWTLYDQWEGIIPVKKSSFSYTFVHEDKIRLEQIRLFTQKFFSLFNMSALICYTRTNKTDIDRIAIVLERRSLGLTEKLRLYDGNLFFVLKIPIRSFPEIGPKRVVYIRGMKVDKGKFTREEFTGFLIIPEHHISAIKFVKKIRKKLAKNLELRKKVLQYIQISDQFDANWEIVMSKVENNDLPFIQLDNLFHLTNDVVHGKKYKIKICPIEIGPQNPADWLKFELIDK